MKNISNKLASFGATLLKFLLVGAIGACVNLAILTLLVSAGVPQVLASLLAIELSIVNNFIWNDRWTFSNKKAQTPAWYTRLLRFQLVSTAGAGLTFSLFMALSYQLKMPYLPAQFFAISIATLLNFAANFRFTWKPAPIKKVKARELSTTGPGQDLLLLEELNSLRSN